MTTGTYAASATSYGAGFEPSAANVVFTQAPQEEPLRFDSDGDDWVAGRRRRPRSKDDLAHLIGATRKRFEAGAAGPEGEPGKEASMATKRLVRVIVVDAHEYVKAEDAILYRSDETFTDKTDQELFFDIPITKLLDDHNTSRVKVRNKKVKEREEFLEPARIRDLDMVVLTIAEFGA